MAKKKHKGRATKDRKQQILNQEELYKSAPHSFVFHRGHVGRNIRQLIKDTKRVMEPYTATKLRVRKKNVFKDFVTVAGSLNISHFLIFTKTEVSTNLRVTCIPRGPTMTFKVCDYVLANDVISSLKKPNMEQSQFSHHPLLVMNNFSGEGKHLKLLTTMFQNLFPSINVNKVRLKNIRRCLMLNYDSATQLIDLRHYNIRVVPVGVSRAMKKIMKVQLPDMGKFEDISEFVALGGNLSESEAEMDGPQNEVTLPQRINKRNIESTKSAIRLVEIGPRMTLQLIKIEEGLCDGKILFHKFIEKTDAELQGQKAMREKKRKLKEMRKLSQARNVQKKEDLKKANKERSLAGMKKADSDSDYDEVPEDKSDDEPSDREYYKQEVGVEPATELFPKKRQQKRTFPGRKMSRGNPKRQRTHR